MIHMQPRIIMLVKANNYYLLIIHLKYKNLELSLASNFFLSNHLLKLIPDKDNK
jgi:hypothetical protein